MDLGLYIHDNHPPKTGETAMTVLKLNLAATKHDKQKLAEDNIRINESLASSTG